MNLSQLFQQRLSLSENQSDKGTAHTYIDSYYNQKFTPLKDESFNLLEIGVQNGYSVSLWREFFSKAMIYAIDMNDCPVCRKFSNVKFYSVDGYCQTTLDMFEDNFFDIIIEDGPHNVESQIYATKEWTRKLKVGGVLAIEDIQDASSVPLIQSAAPSNVESVFYDFRKNNGRWDNMIVELTRKY